MTKYPLSKEPITAELSSNYLKTSQNKIVTAASYLDDAIALIKSNLHGSEFDSACTYINDKILCKMSDVVSDINTALSSLTNAVNEYNDNIYDADGVKYHVADVNYESNVKLEYSSTGGASKTNTTEDTKNLDPNSTSSDTTSSDTTSSDTTSSDTTSSDTTYSKDV